MDNRYYNTSGCFSLTKREVSKYPRLSLQVIDRPPNNSWWTKWRKGSNIKYLFLSFNQHGGISFSEHFVSPFFETTNNIKWNSSRRKHEVLKCIHMGTTGIHVRPHSLNKSQVPNSRLELKTWYFQTSQHNTSWQWHELLIVVWSFFLTLTKPWKSPSNSRRDVEFSTSQLSFQRFFGGLY